MKTKYKLETIHGPLLRDGKIVLSTYEVLLLDQRKQLLIEKLKRIKNIKELKKLIKELENE